MSVLLTKDHPITEKGMMEFQPFGKEPDGTTIRDLSGVVIRALVEELEDCVAAKAGLAAGRQAVQKLVDGLNERIPDPAFRVTADFLRNPWNSYANEFSAFCTQFCSDISGDPDFQFNMARRKAISPIIQVLLRRFSVQQIYKMSVYIAQRYSKNSFFVEAVTLSDHWALMRLMFSERTYRHFGSYRRSCARLWCTAVKGYFVGVPEIFHALPPAQVTERSCIAEGDEYCEWEVSWAQSEVPRRIWQPRRWLTGHTTVQEVKQRERIIEEQARSLDAWHDELQKAYVQQQQLTADLQRRVDHLTILYEAGLTFTSTRDRESLIRHALEALIHKLSYDRVMLTLYDPLRQVAHSARLVGVSPEIAELAYRMEVPVVDSSTVEGTVLLRGEPLLVRDVTAILDRLHPHYRELAIRTGTESFVAVPLKVKNWILGSLTVDRSRAHSLTQEDLELMITFANQLAIALDNAAAYREIEELNVGLEEKVRERTAQLEAANEQLKELNQLKSTFVSVVSHELRTPMTSIRVYVENMLDGLTGTLTEKQKQYLGRIQFNVDRLTRMIIDLLDLSRIEAGRVELQQEPIAIDELMQEVTDNLRSIAEGKSVVLEAHCRSPVDAVHADRDKVTQILTNLIGNAIKFTHPGGTVAVTTEFLEDEQMLRCCVSDTGCGISPDEVPRVFEKFFRGQSTTTDTRGAGLGLAIVKSLVELHGGHIWVESIFGSGSSFYFTLPLTRDRESSSTNG
ncbi:MAG TPA: ATP-binding protein [Nitrospira sp.]|nr:ATP-binding protein [Nitrospira sp.]